VRRLEDHGPVTEDARHEDPLPVVAAEDRVRRRAPPRELRPEAPVRGDGREAPVPGDPIHETPPHEPAVLAQGGLDRRRRGVEKLVQVRPDQERVAREARQIHVRVLRFYDGGEGPVVVMDVTMDVACLQHLQRGSPVLFVQTVQNDARPAGSC